MLAHSPAVTEAYLSCERALAGGQLTPRQRELIALAVAEINGCQYGLRTHAATGKSLGLSEEDIRLARKASASAPRDAAMLHFTRAVVLQRGVISDPDFTALRQAGFTDPHITEIIANIALNIFANYFNSVARTELDAPVAAGGR